MTGDCTGYSTFYTGQGLYLDGGSTVDFGTQIPYRKPRKTINFSLKRSKGRSILFVPDVAFGLVSGRDITMETQRRNEAKKQQERRKFKRKVIHIRGRKEDVLTYEALLRAKGKLQEAGYDDTNLVLYTTPQAIRDLTEDPDLDSYIGFSKPDIIDESIIERISGVSLVRSNSESGLRTARPKINIALKNKTKSRLSYDYENKIIEISGGSELSIGDLYSTIKEHFNKPEQMDDDLPMVTDMKFDGVRMINGWKIKNKDVVDGKIKIDT